MLSPQLIDVTVRALNDRFNRIAAGCTPSRDHYNVKHLVPALLTYSRPFFEDPLLASLVDSCIADGVATVADVRSIQGKFEVEMGEVAMALGEIASRGCALRYSDTLGEVSRNMSLTQKYPAIEYRHIQPALSCLASMAKANSLDGAGPDIGVRIDELSDRFKRARYGFECEEERLMLVRLAKPWRGAEIVKAFGGCPEGQRDLRMTPAEWQTAKHVLKWLEIGRPHRRGGEPIETFTEIVQHVGTFHDWVVFRLLSAQTVEQVLLRYKQRVERFERPRYVESLRPPGATGNPDEKLFQTYIGCYLHDAGLDPFVEVETGPARADGVALRAGRAVVVTYEVKVIRPDDSDEVCERRIADGVYKALRYAHYYDQLLGYLVVFWSRDAEPNLDRIINISGGSAVPVVIDLRASPSISKKRTFTLSSTRVEELVAELRSPDAAAPRAATALQPG